MDINWPIVIIVAVAALALVVFLIRRNQKDEKNMEETMNQVDKKPLGHDSEGEKKI